MRELFGLAHERFGDDRIPKTEFQQFIQEDAVGDLFDWIDFSTRKGLTSFGKLVAKFDGRELGGITFTLDKQSKNRAIYKFSRSHPDSGPQCPQTLQHPPIDIESPPPDEHERGHQGHWGFLSTQS